MCENMVVSEVCAVYELLCSISDRHYTESSNCSVADEEKGRRALNTRVSHRRKRETRVSYARVPFT
jgi:hypothetical protein